MSDQRYEDEMPAIPDGGLSDSMPEWLRRPPAWRTLEDTDVTQTKPTQLSELPEADATVIDPRTFLTDDDLPAWLRAMGPGRRPVERDHSGGGENVTPGTDTSTGPVQASDSEARLVRPDRTVSTPARFVPRTPPISTPAEPTERRESAVRVPASGTSRTDLAGTRWWQGVPMILLLTLLLLVAIGVIVAMSVA